MTRPPDDTPPRAGLRSMARIHRPLTILAGVWLAAILALVIWGAADTAAAGRRAGGQAGAADAADSDPGPVTVTAVPAQLTPRSDLELLTTVPFHRNLVVQRRVIEYAITYPEVTAPEGEDPPPVEPLAAGTTLQTTIGQFLERSQTRELAERLISADATVAQGNRVVLEVRFDRRNDELGSAGSYTGTVSIVDPRVSRVDQQFTAQLAYPWWQYVAALLLAMLVVATLYVWLLRGSFGSRELTLADLEQWLFSRNAMLSIGTGIAAAVSVWTATYFSNPSWGASFPAATALFGASFSAFVAASTAVTAAGAERG